MEKIGHGLTCLIRNQLLQKLLAQPYDNLVEQRTGDVVSRITGDSSLFQEYIMNVIINPLISGIMLVVYTIILFRINVTLSLITVLSFPLLALIISAYHQKTMNASFAYRDGYGEMYNKLIELFGAMKLVKAMKYEDRHSQDLAVTFEDLQDSGIEMNRLASRSTYLNALVTNINLLVVLIFGGYLTATGQLSFAQFISYYIFLQMAYSPIETITIAFASYQKGIGMLQRVFEILELEDQGPKQFGKEPFVYGDIEVKGVGFAYQDSRQIFSDYSCTLKKNSINVIVGPSGVGKTTLLDLALNLYTPQTGFIEIAGQDLQSMDPGDYAAHVALFTQEAIIFDDTIANNIAYFKPESTREEIMAAAKRAQIHNYIQSLDQGYDSLTGERGNRLSGGEKARIVLARIFLKQPALIFMDEPTSNIDSETERIVYHALTELKIHSTIVMIAHNKEALTIADHVIDLSELSGCIVAKSS